VSGHGSRGPWRRLGKHASAQAIMATYRDLDEFPVTTTDLHILTHRFAAHRKWIAFESRFDSMALSTLEERERAAWRWRV
jgi:hypothetical protein